METFAVDAGFAQVKWSVGTKIGLFPSAIAPPVTATTAGLGGEAKRYTSNGRTYVVGDAAFEPLCKQEYERDIQWLMGKVPFFVASAADKAGVDLTNVEVLSLGLPIINYRENSKRLTEIMSDFEVNGTRYTPKVVVTPQGVGALYSYAYEYHHQNNKDDVGLVIDIGGNTAIVVSHKKYCAMAEGSQQYDAMGLSGAAESVVAFLRERRGIQYTLIEAMDIMRSKRIIGRNGKFEDISSDIDQVISDHFKILFGRIQQTYGQSLHHYNHLLLSGGGATVMRSHLPEEWTVKAIVIQDPEYANVRGYFLAAREA